MNINVYENKKVSTELILIVGIILIAGLFLLAIPTQQSGVTAKGMPVEIQEGQVLNLANLPENMVLPNGMVLEGVVLVSEGSLAGTISATAFFEESSEPLKVTWLDENGNDVSYSSHTVLNSPPFGTDSGEQINIWSLRGAEKVKFETWE